MKNVIYAALLIVSLGACQSKSNSKVLPIYGVRQPVTKTVDGKTITDTIYQTIPPIKFINQYGDSINDKNLDGKIYVADFFFTSCPSICPVMQRNMLTVYNEFKNTNSIKIVSYTIDPKYDSVAVLKKYADKLGVEGNTWWFLQGAKDFTYQLAEKNYLVAVKQDNTVKGGYTHQGYFVLVDKQKRVRGAYDGTNPQQVAQLIDDIKILQAEPGPANNK